MDESIIALTGLIIGLILTIYQEVRHYLNHRTISPRAVRIKDAMESKIESDILQAIKQGNLLEHHDIKFEVLKRKK